ncbi:MAG TPA: glycosyltransferase family 39 protein [Thermoanaerobaculaceae bacterium]|nr:glycosyltransferase family 39 protein [Thermoanaerobaculaceae bacterium]HRS16648.1 glycosyltransferase family 39 protein [Thermoanaerobaculaceae bacterium]
MTWTRRRYGWLLAAALALHALLAAALPVSGDEAYYWDCSRHPEWATFDQPALVIWAIIPFRAVLGETRLAVRAPALLASLAIGLLLLPLLRRLGGGEREAARAYLLLHATPLFFLGSFYASTDVAMVAAMLGACWAAVAIAQGERRAWWGFGAAMGLGFLAKFPAVLAGAALIPLLADREVRRDLRSPTPYLAGALALGLTAPVWIWAVRHDWDNITFQLAGRHQSGPLGITWVVEFALATLALATPTLGVAMAGRWWGEARRRETAGRAIAAVMAAPMVVFSLVALREPVAAHWSAPAVVLGAMLLALRGVERKPVVAGAAFGLTVSLAAVGVVACADTLATYLAAPELRLYRKQSTLFGSLVGNEEIAAGLAARLEPGELMASESYTNVHLFAFLSGGRFPARLARLTGGKHGLASLYWHPPASLRGRDVLFVTEDPRKIGPRLAPLFASVAEVGEITVERGGTVVRRATLFRCRDLRAPEGVFTRLRE